MAARENTRITLADIAQRLHLSINTVSQVLRGQEKSARISRQTADKVKQAAKDLQYIPDQLAQGLRLQRTGIVGVFISEMTDATRAGIAHAVLNELERRGLHFLITVAQAGLESCREAWLRNRIDGLIFCGTTPDMSQQFFQDLLARGIPSVIAGGFYHAPGRQLSYPDVSMVSINNIKGTALALEHLCQAGRAKIALICGPYWHSDAVERRDGYAQCLPSPQKPMVASSKKTLPPWQRGYEAVEQLLHNKSSPDAILAYDDTVAVGAVKALTDRKIKVPTQIAIIGFDDAPEAQYCSPSLTTLRQPVEIIGRKSVELLCRHMGGAHDIEHIRVEPSLIIRASTVANQPKEKMS